ncbi:RagB/SusD family nutrient uptake outer membrane protein [Maribacter sp. MMG018]|uniref:RagB/SusD family nutrient uptake outer membrane protein n=1 Tax=Maribacter sp. MMG018 TaxID=2822688 RepID=UPI001B383D90|nr:RagB/SusD family nutrient uptake outer membrane protein [Maribacter sp. MMG018]MBQ4913622.1 RagB/SusD family nutrient uptake outer membrane protein [Maribacter sp. MMG018]
MKQYIYKAYGMGVFICLLIFSSCDLTTAVDDVEPLYTISADEAIYDEKSADLALLGVYSGMTQYGLDFPTVFFVPDIFLGYSNAGFYANNEEQLGWSSNNPILTGSIQHGAYTRFYSLINNANWVIEQTGMLSDDIFDTPGRRAEVIAEARLMRALATFYLLRAYGQFYDTSSEFGVVLRTDPARYEEELPRSSVQETYTAILADIEDGIANAPENRGKTFTNKTFARAFKAKVLLYMGDYQQAASEAKAVIENPGSGFALEADYASIFGPHDSPTLFEKSEIIFGIPGVETPEGTGVGWGNFYNGFSAGVDPVYFDMVNTGTLTIGGQTIAHDGGRVESITDPFGGSLGTPLMTKYSDYTTDYEMHYVMRMAEIYLIHAEAAARASGMVTPEALSSLNEVRKRAGATTTGGDGFETYPESISLSEFLEAVRIEKLVELYAENGENWFDAVRYAYEDGGFNSGFQVSEIKATATDPNKFIFPIPQTSVEVNSLLVQNPGYQ